MRLSGEKIMAKQNKRPTTDLQQCKREIKALLETHNCYLMSADEWSNVLIVDADTNETDGGLNPK